MYESAAAEVMQLNEADERDGRSRKPVLIEAKGFDVTVPAWGTPRKRVLRLESMLRDLFSSCGKIKSVCIPHAYHSCTIKSLMELRWMDKTSCYCALEKDSHIKALKSAKSHRSCRSKIVIVRGYDTSLPKKIIKRALSEHFSSCGEVLVVDLFPNKRSPTINLKFAYVSIYGEDAKEKALQLSGSDMGGFKLVVEKAIGVKPRQDRGRPLSEDYVGTLSFPELVALINKTMENPNHNEEKKKRKTSK